MKRFNNLLVSIMASIGLAVAIFFATITFVWIDVPNMVAGYIACSILFAVIISIFTIFIIFRCYSYCVFTDEYICFKKILRKKVIVRVSEIEKIEIQSCPRYSIDCYDSYVVYSATSKISVNITFSTEKFLKYYFSKFSHLIEDKRVKQESFIG